MLDIGFSELILFAIILIIFIGPERLPTVIRTLGKYYVMLKNTIFELQGIVTEEFNINDLQKQLNEEIKKLRDTEIELREHIKEINSELSKLTQQKLKIDSYQNDFLVNTDNQKGIEKNES
ncbi:Sec-independent protein translocase protein TatB [Acinetobacter pittii]